MIEIKIGNSVRMVYSSCGLPTFHTAAVKTSNNSKK